MSRTVDFLTAFNNMSIPVGNFGIPRSNMPQIDVKYVPEFMEFLEDNEVEVSFESVPAFKLSLTQSEINKMKVIKLMRLTRRKDERILRIFVSSDGYVLDGSHRFVAALNINRQQLIAVTRIGLPIRELLKLVRRFPNARYRNISDAKLS